MKLVFDENVFTLRSKTIVKDEQGNKLFWGIYDFSFKHRRRIYKNDDEVAFTQLMIEKENNEVHVCTPLEKLKYYIINDKEASNGLKVIGDIYNWDFKVVDQDNVEVISSKAKYELETSLELQDCVEFIYSFARVDK